MKPKNWRSYYGYRPSRALPTLPPWRPEATRAQEYFDWLAGERGWPVEQAASYARSQPRRGLISAVHDRSPEGPRAPQAPKPRVVAATVPKVAATANTHVYREAWLHAVAAALAEPFKRLGHPIPAKVRLTCGFPSVRGIAAKNQRIGECWSDSRSADGHHEILVSPVIADSMRVAGILAHELIHASVGVEHGHKGPFRAMAKAIGLEGKMTATTEGDAFKQLLLPILDAVGPYPHAELHAMTNGRKKQVARMVKCQCATCGYTVRTTRQWLDDRGAPHCPEHGEMTVAP